METSLPDLENQWPRGSASPAAAAARIVPRATAIDDARYRPALGVLRITAAFGVVALHVSGFTLIGAPHGTAAWWIGDFYRATTRRRGCWSRSCGEKATIRGHL